MSGKHIILTARGVEVACGEKLPRLDILAYNGGVMRVPGWGALAIDLAGLDLTGQVRVLADHDASLDGILGHGAAETRDGKLLVSSAAMRQRCPLPPLAIPLGALGGLARDSPGSGRRRRRADATLTTKSTKDARARPENEKAARR